MEWNGMEWNVWYKSYVYTPARLICAWYPCCNGPVRRSIPGPALRARRSRCLRSVTRWETCAGPSPSLFPLPSLSVPPSVSPSLYSSTKHSEYREGILWILCALPRNLFPTLFISSAPPRSIEDEEHDAENFYDQRHPAHSRSSPLWMCFKPVVTYKLHIGCKRCQSASLLNRISSSQSLDMHLQCIMHRRRYRHRLRLRLT